MGTGLLNRWNVRMYIIFKFMSNLIKCFICLTKNVPLSQFSLPSLGMKMFLEVKHLLKSIFPFDFSRKIFFLLLRVHIERVRMVLSPNISIFIFYFFSSVSSEGIP